MTYLEESCKIAGVHFSKHVCFRKTHIRKEQDKILYMLSLCPREEYC